MNKEPSATGCEACPSHHAGNLIKLGINMSNWNYVVALAGNPNTGKSTVFNSLTGLRQHTGNWPGKTVAACGWMEQRSTSSTRFRQPIFCAPLALKRATKLVW